MNGEWKDNLGYCPVQKGTLVDVVYFDGSVSLGAEALVFASQLGSHPYWNAFDWSLIHNHEPSTILKWRLHEEKDSNPDHATMEIYKDLIARVKKSATINTLQHATH